MSTQSTHRDGSNPYTPTYGNDVSEELVQKIIEFYRGHRTAFSGTEATAIGTAVTSILNGTFKV